MTFNDGNTIKELIAADVNGFFSKTWGAALIFLACAWERNPAIGLRLSVHEYLHALADKGGLGSMYIARDLGGNIVGASYDTTGERSDGTRTRIAEAPRENMSTDDREKVSKIKAKNNS